MPVATIEPAEARLNIARKLPEERRHEAIAESKRQTGDATPLWTPNPDREDGTPNPQRMAMESQADELFYGGAAGGGKSDLVLGLAFTRHKRSAIFRRIYKNLKALIKRSIQIVGSDDDYNRSEKEWQLGDRYIQFGSVQYEKDKKNWQGQPHDLKAFDEITEFTRTQYQFIIGWNRSTDPDQRSRVVVTGNPPTDEAGSWVIEEWGPWLDPEHPHKAEPGELLWYYYDEETQKPVWLDSGDPMVVDGEKIYPTSRTFIPAYLEDNPHLNYDSSYKGRLQSLPEPLRGILLRGDFSAYKSQDPWQAIPTAWVRAAQRRWMEREKPDTPLSGVGVDVARGGKDALVSAKRRGTWFEEPHKTAGVNVEDGPAAAGLVHQQLENESVIGYINIDVIGVGSSPYDSLKAMPAYEDIVVGVNVAEKSHYVAYSKGDKDDGEKEVLFTMRNKRAEMYWRMRESLDPEHGDDLALPPDNEILADLCAARYKMLAGGKIQIEKKEDIKQRIGRSPDVGEAIMLARGRFAEEPQKERKTAWVHRR